MTQHPWIVALISTDYDLKDERKAVIGFLRDNHFEVSAFEDPSFPVQEGIHSHDNCLQALKRADLAILLVNKRYGGQYYLGHDISITEAEYNSLGIPTIVFVNRRTWDERDSYRRQLKNPNFESAASYDAGEVDIQTIHFVDRIQHVYQDKGRSNWLNFWEDVEDLKRQLPEVMGSRSVTILHEIHDCQIKEIRNRRTSTGLSMSLGDVIDRGYYIEPEYTIQDGTIEDADTLAKGVNQKLLNNESCLVLGEAGAGKTTFMAQCFLSMTELVNDNPFLIPAYVWLKGMSPESSFSVEEFIRIACEQYLHKDYYPFFNLDGFHFIFFLDGFDELAEKLSKDDLQRLHSTEIFSWPLMLTSRQQYAERYLCSNEFASTFGCSITLNDWTSETAKKYIKKFCELQDKGAGFEQRIMTLLVENDDLHDVLKTPLLITILLYVIERSGMEIPETIRSRTQLFEECLDKLAEREIESKIKLKKGIPNNYDLVTHWAFFAWMIYENRLKGEKSIHVVDAISKIKAIINNTEIEWPSTIYEIIFDIKGEYAFGSFHEQFLEFLIAYTLSFACLNKLPPYPEFLKYVMRPEINRYFRGIVLSKPEEEQQEIFKNIKDLYWNCAGKTTDDDILKRVHAVYHLSRLSSKNDMDEINRIFNSEKERAVLQSLYFGIIKKGNLQREQEFFDLLNTDVEYSNLNRGYHLAYYDSLFSKGSLPYCDDISVGWDGPLRAFQRHFSSKDLEHYYLRRIDLVTMRHFMVYRKKREPLTDKDLEQFEAWLSKVPIGANLGYQSLVEEEYQRLKETYMELE